jgi:hypothetical protein
VGGATIVNRPAPLQTDTLTRVFAGGLAGHLLEFDAGPGHPWAVFDHTIDVGGALISGVPAPLQTGTLTRVFARSG